MRDWSHIIMNELCILFYRKYSHTRLEIVWGHNHSVSSIKALGKRSLGPDAQEQLKEYFEDGLSIAQTTKRFHEAAEKRAETFLKNLQSQQKIIL